MVDINQVQDKYINNGFSVEFKCADGKDLAISDAHHDFRDIDTEYIKSTLPECKGILSKPVKNEEKKLAEIIMYVMDPNNENNINDDVMNILIKGGNITNIDTQQITLDGQINGGEYTTFDMGPLGWDESMSSSSKKKKQINQKYRKGKNKKFNNKKSKEEIKPSNNVTPSLQQTIMNQTGLQKVFIIDDIHSTAFVENIKTNIEGIDKPFWCYLQTPQTIFDPAGKITPISQPHIFENGNVEYGWYDIRQNKDVNPDPKNTNLVSETLQYPSVAEEETISYNRQKLTLKNDVHLTIKGNPYDPYSHKVNFFSKIDSDNNIFAVFDNQSATIKNRNYMSTNNIKGQIRPDNNLITEKLPISMGLKSHLVAKRFGDQGQANVTCDEIIPIIKKQNNEYITEKTNGNHIFVSKDRLAIGAALLYNAPMILHIKAGVPKNKLHNILYIRNDLLIGQIEKQKEDRNTINDLIVKINEQIDNINNEAVDKLKNKINTQIDNFTKLLEKENDTLFDYIKIVEMNLSVYIQCKILQSKISNIVRITDISTNETTTPKELNMKRKEINDVVMKLNELINVNSTNDGGNMSIKETVTQPLNLNRPSNKRRTGRSNANILPGNISELRQYWKPVFDRIYIYETGDTIIARSFTTGCLSRCDFVKDSEKDKLIKILEQHTPEIIRDTTAAFKVMINGFSPTETITTSNIVTEWLQKVNNHSIFKPFQGKGNKLGSMKSEKIFIDEFIEKNANMPIPEWISSLKRNNDGQFENSRLLDLQFARLVYSYFNPRIINYGLHITDKLNSAMLEYYNETQNGFTPFSDIYYGYEDEGINTSIENDIKYHTEMDYFVKAYGNGSSIGDTQSQFMATVLDIVWRTQNIQDSILKFNQINDGIIETTVEKNMGNEKNDVLGFNEESNDMDPVVQINNYVIEMLYTDLTIDDDNENETETEKDNPWKVDNDGSTRIMFTNKGVMKQSCGFYKNCIEPILKIIQLRDK
jgi:hypothetical protein